MGSNINTNPSRWNNDRLFSMERLQLLTFYCICLALALLQLQSAVFEHVLNQIHGLGQVRRWMRNQAINPKMNDILENPWHLNIFMDGFYRFDQLLISHLTAGICGFLCLSSRSLLERVFKGSGHCIRVYGELSSNWRGCEISKDMLHKPWWPRTVFLSAQRVSLHSIIYPTELAMFGKSTGIWSDNVLRAYIVKSGHDDNDWNVEYMTLMVLFTQTKSRVLCCLR